MDRAADRTPARTRNRQITVTGVGLRIPDRTDFGTWEQAGRKMAHIANCSAWCLGDWLVYGQHKYTDRYRQVVTAVSLDYQTLRNYAWVARRFELERRRPRLSFQHHAEVAAVSVEDQERWLSLAEDGHWSRNELRRNVRAGRGDRPAPPAGPALPRLSVSADHIARWQNAARRLDCDLDQWIVATLDDRARQTLG